MLETRVDHYHVRGRFSIDEQLFTDRDRAEEYSEDLAETARLLDQQRAEATGGPLLLSVDGDRYQGYRATRPDGTLRYTIRVIDCSGCGVDRSTIDNA